MEGSCMERKLAERDAVSSRITEKSPAWNWVEGSPKCFLKRVCAEAETVSEIPMSWFPGREAIYGVEGFLGNIFKKRLYSASHLL